MKKYLLYMLLLCVVVGYSLSAFADARETISKQDKDNLSKLSWLTGTWVANADGDHLEEIWSEPVGDTMMGVFRWVKGGKVWINEIVTITAESDGLVFRLRHFDRKMTAWEDKDKPFYYPVKHIGRSEIVFENPKRDHPRRITYRRVDDTLYIIVSGVGEDQKEDQQEFVFHRQ